MGRRDSLMVDDSAGKQVIDAMTAPVKKMGAALGLYKETPPPTPTPAQKSYADEQHAKDVAAANASFAKTAAGSAHGQTPRRQRLASKYSGGK